MFLVWENFLSCTMILLDFVSKLTELQNFSHIVFVSLFSFWFVSFCNLLMDDLVDGSFCLAYCRLSLRFSFIPQEVKCRRLLSWSQPNVFGIHPCQKVLGWMNKKKFELKISSILISNVLTSALANWYLDDMMGMFRCRGLSGKISMGRWSPSNDLPVRKRTSRDFRLGVTRAISKMSGVPCVHLSGCVHRYLDMPVLALSQFLRDNDQTLLLWHN